MPLKRVAVVVALSLVVLPLAAACSKNSPSEPTPPPNTQRASVAVTSLSPSSDRAAAGGYIYRVVVHLRESAGVAATVSAVDLTFTSGSTVVATSHHDQLIPGASNRIAAGGTADTRELVTTDSDAAHPAATTVAARVTYNDTATSEATVSGAADVPAPPAQPPQTFALTGVITDQGTGAAIDGARVEAINGANAGKFTFTNANGAYTLDGLVGETFRMRASAAGYDNGEQNVTVPAISRADMLLRRTGSGCVYSVAPGSIGTVSRNGSSLTFTLTRTAGSCGWTASTDVSWINPASTSGSGDATVTFTVNPNTTFVGRVGAITFEWAAGGRAEITVRQDADIPAFCVATIGVGGSSTISVPAAGGQFTASIAPVAGMPPGICGSWTATASSGIAFVGPSSGPVLPASVLFNVLPNGTGNARTLFLTVSVGSGPSIAVTINQNP
jgi:hypothetical protein